MDINLKNKLNNKLDKLIAYLEQSEESIYTHLTPKDLLSILREIGLIKRKLNFYLFQQVPYKKLQLIMVGDMSLMT